MILMKNFFFGNDDDLTSDAVPFMNLEEKHLPFVGWTFRRYGNKPKNNVKEIFNSSSDDNNNNDKKSSHKDKSKKKKKDKKT